MRKIGLLSDTHGTIDPKVFEFFVACDEIWHAGDIGNIMTADRLSAFKPLKAVCGNIDGQDVRIVYPKNQRFKCEEVDVWITHIGGYPGKYDRLVRDKLMQCPPDLFICGHSHILKVIYDKKLNLLHLNPGAAGNSGFHLVKTMLRFTIDGKEIKDLEILEIPRERHVSF
ncbi:MAG: metallophosphoesterase family protein [Bacteroidota bacterium]|nr:metallophosphoesterase family protein [Bacteroidota bacterium]